MTYHIIRQWTTPYACGDSSLVPEPTSLFNGVPHHQAVDPSGGDTTNNDSSVAQELSSDAEMSI
jgi:hypothetical protein